MLSGYHVKIRKSFKFKNMTLRVYRGNILKISCPRLISTATIEKFIDSKENWIKSQSEKFVQQKTVVSFSKEFKFPFLGNEFSVIFKESNCKKIIEIDQDMRQITIFNKKYDENKIRTQFFKWLEQQCESIVQNLLPKYTLKIGQIPTKIRIKSYRARWGACNSKKELFFNWQLICLEPKYIDYVVAHEVAHLRYMNHSPEFYDLLKSWGFKIKEIHKILKKQGNIF